MHAHNRLGLLLAIAGSLASCSSATFRGPTLTVATEGDYWLDGERTEHARTDYRYYGTTTVDVVPGPVAAAAPGADPHGSTRPDFAREPVRQQIEVPAPIAPWLFPFDFVLEVALRSVTGAPDQHAALRPLPVASPVVQGFAPAGIEDLRTRAQAARVAR